MNVTSPLISLYWLISLSHNIKVIGCMTRLFFPVHSFSSKYDSEIVGEGGRGGGGVMLCKVVHKLAVHTSHLTWTVSRDIDNHIVTLSSISAVSPALVSSRVS